MKETRQELIDNRKSFRMLWSRDHLYIVGDRWRGAPRVQKTKDCKRDVVQVGKKINIVVIK